MLFLPLTLIFNLFLTASSYKILVLFPYPGKSHIEVFLPLTKELARRGHEVTVVSHVPLKTPIPNYTDIRLGDKKVGMTDIFNIESVTNTRLTKWLAVLPVMEISDYNCRLNLESPPIQELLKSKETFDLIITEFFISDCFLGFVEKFKAPFIGVSSCPTLQWINDRFGNPTNPSYIPDSLIGYSDRMTFLERVENFLVGIFRRGMFTWIINIGDEKYNRELFGRGAPNVRDIILNSSLFLVNTHYSLNLPRPLVPAVVEIGGIHIEGVKKLPVDLEKWINESTHGVIYFSLGSMIKGHTFPDEKREEFLKAFARLPQRVLWKWENETMPGKPDNVMIQKWMPQLDILCHPNVKAFISHGGLLGTTEAVHCGVPVMVMPQYGDQFTNAKALEANGGGVILHLYEATEEKVYNALKTILDPSFKKQAEELSARFRDRPMPPLETAIYWVEYVARHRGAHHMRTAAVGMPLYKYLLLDVIAFLLLVFGVISALFFYVTRAVFRKLFGKKNKKKSD